MADQRTRKTAEQIMQALRKCRDTMSCENCPYFNKRDDNCGNAVMTDAADAIEEMLKAIKAKDKHLMEAQAEIRRLHRSCIAFEE